MSGATDAESTLQSNSSAPEHRPRKREFFGADRCRSLPFVLSAICSPGTRQ
jgi:hypothetical protein